jgi:glycerol-3-phosphate dehydrogenase
VRQLRADLPALNTVGLLGGAQYFDAQMDDARLCVEVVHTAALNGAIVANYVEATAFEFDGGSIRGVQARDHVDAGEFVIRARQVLNATGPWGDTIRRLAGETGGPMLKPTKGVHLVAPGRDLPAALLLLHPADGRVFFVIPWMGKTLLGTTDTECADSPDKLQVTQEDERYLLEGYNRYLSPALTASEVLGSFVGVRPLLAESASPSARSREFHVATGPSGLLTVAGGKYTTFRHMAEVITDKVCEHLGIRRRCRTRECHLNGAPDSSAQAMADLARRLAAEHGVEASSARHLVDRYGLRASDVADYCRGDATLSAQVVAGEPDLLAEFAYQRDHEMARRPEDFLLRRTRLGLFCPRLLEAPPAAALAAMAAPERALH